MGGEKSLGRGLGFDPLYLSLSSPDRQVRVLGSVVFAQSAGGKAACRAEGSYAAADDMVTTVGDYATFLRAVVDAKGYGPALAADRDRVQSDKGDQRVVDCTPIPAVPCPQAQGYGLGFNVLRYGDVIILEHGGADWSELAVA